MTDGTDPILAVSSQSLLVISGQAKGTVIPIPLGELLLGREAGQAGRLGGDPMLSRRHARIIIDGHGQVVLEDLGSTNGTFLNGARVTSRQPIRASDIIEVGGSKLQVLEATPARTSPRIPAADVTRPGRIPDEAPSGEWEGLGADTDTAPPDRVASAPPPRPPPPPRPAPARPAPEPRRGRATVQGQVRGIQQRNGGEQGSGVAWAFRIERYDQDGNRLQPIPAQMRGIAFEGSFSDGDEVIATGVWKAGTLHCDRVENRTTGATIKPKSYKKALVVFLLIVAVMVAGFIALGIHSDQVSQRRADQAHQQYCQQVQQQGGTAPDC